MSIRRIIDANDNRAREALRVMEDTARFVLDDGRLSAALKTLRHDLAQALEPLGDLARDRDTPGDVGTTITSGREMTRTSAADVACAAGRRLSEALRAIEEFAKTIDPVAAARIEQLRYRGYDLEQRLNLAMSRRAPRQWTVCVLLTEALCGGRSWCSVATSVLAAEPDCVQVREPELGDRALLQCARQLVDMASPTTQVIVNDRPDIAALAGAVGVHLGQGDLPCAEVRRHLGPEAIIGVSTSCLEDAERAFADGADYCGVGPMFTSTTKHKDVIAGPAYLRAYLQWGRLPHLAIGGITAERISALPGVRGVAVSSAVCAAEDPGAVVRELKSALVVNA